MPGSGQFSLWALCPLLSQLVAVSSAHRQGVGAASLYIFALSVGYICLLMAGMWMVLVTQERPHGRCFQCPNPGSFMQETRLMTNEYSSQSTYSFTIKRWNKKLDLNIINPFRASQIYVAPGSGKSFAIVNNYIKQQIERGLRCTSTTISSPISRNYLQPPGHHLDAYESSPSSTSSALTTRIKVIAALITQPL